MIRSVRTCYLKVTTCRKSTSKGRMLSSTVGASSSGDCLGFIGLGSMGSKMVANFQSEGKILMVYDLNSEAVDKAVAGGNGNVLKGSIEEIGRRCETVISILPNDEALQEVSRHLLPQPITTTHISCSTVSPLTSRELEKTYRLNSKTFIAAPVFARPDGIAKRQAVWMISGEGKGRILAASLLSSGGKIVDYGDDPGAANVVKLCGNFLIAASIESIAESMALAEKHGVDRVEVMKLLSSTIFDCLIYKGYGQRVAERDHRPGGFSLALGLKDVTLVGKAAKEAEVPMPFLSTLLDRYTCAKANGRADFDWSAIGLTVAEHAGIDVSKDVKRNEDAVRSGNTY